jgi:NodT family efflux transporter outer membrane factor (OMF) lipoprotein
MGWRHFRRLVTPKLTRKALRRPFALAFLVPVVVVQAGCLTHPSQWLHNGLKVGPNYSRPLAPVAEEWIEGSDPAIQNRHLRDWWEVFEDPALNSMIQTAYENNPTVRIMATRVIQARAGQAIAVGNIFPQSQQFSGSYTRAALNSNLPLIGSLSRSTAGHRGESLDFNNWFYGFNLSWELDLWGRLRRSIESNNASLDASVENYDDALVTLFADVATNYVQFRITQQRIKIAQDNVKIQEGVLTLAKEKFRVGTTNRLDVEQARTVLAQTRSTIPSLQIGLGQANDTLCILLGVPPRNLEPELGPGPDPNGSPVPVSPAWVAAGIPADLLRLRPDVRGAERQVAAQSAQIGIAEAALYPTISINGIIGWDAQDFSQAFSSTGLIGLIIPSFNWNILNYGRIKNNVRLQEARTQELIAAYQTTVLSAGREVQTSLRGFMRSRQQAGELAQSVEAARAATELGVKQYKTGTIDFNRVFNLETTQVQQQDNLAVAAGNISLNLINTYRALGGGWELRLDNEDDNVKPAAYTPASAPAPAPAPTSAALAPPASGADLPAPGPQVKPETPRPEVKPAPPLPEPLPSARPGL